MPARTYVVTGAASGIGAATTARLTNVGHRVITVDLHDADVTVDLATADGRTALVEGVRAIAGDAVDAVIAGAGISSDDPVTVRVNYFGAVATLEGLRPLLAKGHRPRAATISSIASVQAIDEAIVTACTAGDEDEATRAAEGKGPLVYGSTKRALSRWVRRNAPTPEWAGAGITLNAVAPGVVRTPMTAPLLADPTWHAIVDDAVPMPLGGYAEPEEIAALLDWLTSADNSKTTGQVIFIDGGADVVLRGEDVW